MSKMKVIIASYTIFIGVYLFIIYIFISKALGEPEMVGKFDARWVYVIMEFYYIYMVIKGMFDFKDALKKYRKDQDQKLIDNLIEKQ